LPHRSGAGRAGRTAQRVRLLAGQAVAASAMAFYEGSGGANRAAERAAAAPHPLMSCQHVTACSQPVLVCFYYYF